MTRKIRIVLVDDHPDLRRCIANRLSCEPDLELVAEAADGETAVSAIRRFHPDVVLMDISLPGLDGIEATRVVRSLWPDVRIIGLSMYDESDEAQAIREAGAVAFVNKSGPIEELLSAIRASANLPAG